MLQKINDIEIFYETFDPWNYEATPDDIKRRDIILSEIPNQHYEYALDLGCGHGFITRYIPASHIIGVDVSANAIKQAQSIIYQEKEKNTRLKHKSITYTQSNILDTMDNSDISDTLSKIGGFDLIIITGILYSHYIGSSSTFLTEMIDSLLKNDGILLTCHIDEWYTMRFPFFLMENYYFSYRTYTQNLEVYIK